MKLLDKIKDLFMDEVVDDDEVEVEEEEVREVRPPVVEKPKKEENSLPKVMRDNIEDELKLKTRSEERTQTRVKPEEFIKELNENAKTVPKRVDAPPKTFSFEKEFDFEDYMPTRKTREEVTEVKVSENINVLDAEKEVPKKVSELYPKKEEVREKPKFKATPVISPVYGILDKNYKKDEVKERDDDNSLLRRPSKKVDFETVRKKAFGNLSDEIKDNMLCENCELYKEVKRISALKEDDLLYNMTVDEEEEEEEEITISKAYDNYKEFGVAYEPETFRKKHEAVEEPEEDNMVLEKMEENKHDMEDLIKNAKKVDAPEVDEEEEEVISKPDIIYRDKVEEDNDEEEKTPKRSDKNKKDVKVDDDFFDLIDSMYKERTDD